MLFNSLEYGIFLILVFLAYWALARTGWLRVAFLLIASWVFYAASNPFFLFLIIGSTVTDFFAGLRMERAEQRGDPRGRKRWLVLSLCVNLGLLAVFKYANFFYESVVSAANVIGADMVFERLDILLPAGISFYTFQTMSYSIDVYRGRLRAEHDFLRFAFFVGFFPQLIAGPIVRAVDFMHQIGRRPFLSKQQASRAFWLIGIGLAKKVCIADFLAVNLVDRVFADPASFSSVEVMIGLYAYTMQVYMDFSAYTDIAIGSALLLGFHLPDNFDRPYQAIHIADFWRRWHMTLGSWLRDYLYFPLGGSKKGDARTYLNLYITFLLIGLWHGAKWTFVVYGLLHATAMCLNRFVRVTVAKRKRPTLNAWGYVWRIALTLHFVVLARILFRAQDFAEAGRIIAAIFDGSTYVTFAPEVLLLLGACYLHHWTPRKWVDDLSVAWLRLPALAQGALLAVGILGIMQVAHSDVKAFIYFQF